MVTAVILNSSAGLPHPDDPSLKIPMVTAVAPNGIPTSGGAHTYGYDVSGNLITDTWVVNGATYIMTFTYTNGALTGKTDWVKQ